MWECFAESLNSRNDRSTGRIGTAASGILQYHKQSIINHRCIIFNVGANLPRRRALCSASSSHLLVPTFRLSTVGSRKFNVSAPRIWNRLPEDVAAAPSLSTFRRRLKLTFSNSHIRMLLYIRHPSGPCGDTGHLGHYKNNWTELKPNYSNGPSIFWRPFYSRHPPEQQPSLSTQGHLYGPFNYIFLVWPFLYASVYGLSLPIRPFQGPLYAVIWPFYPMGPRVGEFGGDLQWLWLYSLTITADTDKNILVDQLKQFNRYVTD